MPYQKNRVQSYDHTTNQYYLIDTSAEDWHLLGQSYKPYKRVKLIYPTGAKINEVLSAHKDFISILKVLTKPPKSIAYEGRAYIIELEPLENLILGGL